MLTFPFTDPGVRRVPTAGELRERRRVEEANREVVGYIGTVFGVRAVRRVPIKPVEEAEVSEELESDDRRDVSSGSEETSESK